MKTNMRAAVLHGVGDLRIETIPVPVCRQDEVLLRVRRCGVCGSDIPRVFIRGTYHFPTVPGHEFSGEVVADPSGELLGKRVCVFPLLPCRSCAACRREDYALCEQYDYYGSRRDGAWAEYVAVKKWNLIPIPDGISFDEAAMCEPCAVAVHGVRRAGIREKDRVLILGAGPIGLLLAQTARVFGASEVFLSDLDPAKAAFAQKLGFSIYDGTENFADVAIEGTGASSAWESCLAGVRRGGTVLCLGNPSREMTLSQGGYWHILRKELTVKGTWNSQYGSKQNDWHDAIRLMAEGRLQTRPLITHTVCLEELPQMLERIRDHREFTVKAMLALD